ncbi:MAG TPA: hypothetical protein VI306_05090 [Pyrinomonadaceae bacterium]
MKKLKLLSMAVVLTLMMATGVFAGIIQTGAASPEPPPSTDPGIIQTGIQTPSDQQYSAGPSDAFAEVAMNLLQGVLSVF